jgi:hypothetical protein
VTRQAPLKFAILRHRNGSPEGAAVAGPPRFDAQANALCKRLQDDPGFSFRRLRNFSQSIAFLGS